MPIIRDETKRKKIIALLTKAYWMEIETVQNYIANSVNLDGVRAEEIKKSLAADVTDEIVVRRTASDDPRTLAREGLLGLGFNPQEADGLLDGVAGETPEDLIAEALRAAR